MGVVYEAFDPLIQRTVAIKTILKSSFDKSEAQEAFSRFRREAQAAGRLTHPKIVSIYEYGEDEEMAYIVMELIRGKEMKEYFDRDERFEIKDSIRIMLQLLDALDYSHSRGVVHRDIKPANILITEDGQIKVADFGIAKIESTHLTQVGIVLGTPTYMSPEQFMGKAVDRRTDIYSAGVVLYQFLTGARPFTGSVISIMHKAVNQEAVPPSQLNPAVSKSLDEVVKKAMAKNPDGRYQTAAEFMEALKRAAGDIPTEASNKTLIAAGEMFAAADPIIALPGSAAYNTTPHQSDIETWRNITNSQNLADFRRYLEEYPAGEFAELAKLRIAAPEKADAQARKVEEHRKLANKEQARRKKEAEEVKAKAETQHQKETEEKVRLARKIAEIKNEAAKTKLNTEAQRKKDAEEQARRARELTGVMAEKERRLAGVVAGREAEREAERKLGAETKQKLEARIKRKKEIEEEQTRPEKEFAEAKAQAEAEQKHRLAEEERICRENEYAEARARAEVKRKQEAAEQARRIRAKVTAIAVGAAIVIAGAAIWYALRTSPKPAPIITKPGTLSTPTTGGQNASGVADVPAGITQPAPVSSPH